jgi:hypothetical protein
MPTGQGYSQYGYVHPATHPSDVPGTGCVSRTPCHHPIHNGDIVILPSTFDCSPYLPLGQLVCNQLKTYGAIVEDQTCNDCSEYAFGFGLKADGTTAWTYSTDLKPLLSAVTMAQFEVVQEGTIYCESGHTYGIDCW